MSKTLDPTDREASRVREDYSPEPLLSFVTVCFDSSRTIRETIDSIDAAIVSTQGGEIEHLIVDGVSSDQTLEIIDACAAPHRRVVSERDSGIFNAMNKGLRLARGKYVWFLNSDDLLDGSAPDWMQILLERLRADQSDVVVGEIRMFRDIAGRRCITREWRLPRDLPRAVRFGWHPPHPAFIARRSLLSEVGAFDERKPIAADYKLMLSAIDRARGRIGRIGYNLTLMREGGASSGSLRAIMKANVECYVAHRERGQSRVGAGLSVAMKLSRKVFQRVEVLSRKT